jgi:hypothetical protein
VCLPVACGSGLWWGGQIWNTCWEAQSVPLESWAMGVSLDRGPTPHPLSMRRRKLESSSERMRRALLVIRSMDSVSRNF